MWLFEKGLEVKGVKKYEGMLKGKESIESIVKFMTIEYWCKSEKEKLLIKYVIQDILNDIKQINIISLIISIAISILNDLFGQEKRIVIIILFIIYAMLTAFLINLVYYYRTCKLYLSVIEDVDDGE